MSTVSNDGGYDENADQGGITVHQISESACRKRKVSGVELVAKGQFTPEAASELTLTQ
jgi:hypothetical protein